MLGSNQPVIAGPGQAHHTTVLWTILIAIVLIVLAIWLYHKFVK